MRIDHPQTAIREFNNNTCLFICYVYCCGLLPDSLADWMGFYQKALKKNVIADDGYITDADRLFYCLTGKKVKVIKKEIITIDDIKEKTPVLYSMNGKDGHFVVVENGKIVFNPLKVSQNVNKGKPISARIIHYLTEA
ncbi:MAG: DUF261 family protein [Treponema sp.]|nr:DUF261 family protein [Treponema sp.]MBR0487488.1 DUF261 family protein [Treponema sp.]